MSSGMIKEAELETADSSTERADKMGGWVVCEVRSFHCLQLLHFVYS